MDYWELQLGFLLTNQSPIYRNWTDKSQKWLREMVQFLKVVNNDFAQQPACLDAFAMLVRFLKVAPKNLKNDFRKWLDFSKLLKTNLKND